MLKFNTHMYLYVIEISLKFEQIILTILRDIK